jgi:hypothetical protein
VAKGYCYFISIKNANSFAESINENGASTRRSGERWAGVGHHVFSIGDVPGLVHAVFDNQAEKSGSDSSYARPLRAFGKAL